MVRIVERRRVLPPVRAPSAFSARCPSGRSNVNSAGPCLGDTETVEHLGREHVVGCHPKGVPRVVGGYERPDELENAVDRNALDRDQPATDERRVPGVDDIDAVREVVEANRIEMQRLAVPRVAGEETRMAVARSEERDDPQDPDEELVARDRRCSLRQVVHLGPEALARDAAERSGWSISIEAAELAHVVRGRRRCGGPGVRPRGRPWRPERGAGPASASAEMMSFRLLHVKI